MLNRRPRARAAVAAVPAALVAALAVAPAAEAASLLSGSLEAADAQKRRCHARLAAPGADGVVRRTVTLREASVLRADLRAKGGDWDLGVFDLRSGRSLGGSAGPRSSEVAQAVVPAGRIVVQACRRKGSTETAKLRVRSYAIPLRKAGEAREISQVVEVDTPTRADKQRLQSLGLDLTEHGDDTHLEVVLHGAEDLATLKRAGFTYEVEIPDLAARSIERQLADARYAKRTKRSSLPSGRDAYRRLADFEADLKALAESRPDLVKPITLPFRTVEGRQVHGVEITKDVQAKDGKPVHVQLGVHHAREWPSGELPMEFATDLVKNYGSDQRVTRLVDQVRTIVVPIVNPDGFTLSRDAPTDLRALGTTAPVTRAVVRALDPLGIYGDLDALGSSTVGLDAGGFVDQAASNPGGISAILIDAQTQGFAYKRRNCRIVDGQTQEPGLCAQPGNRTRGTDPNRNYGGFWGGPGASTSPTVDTYRGAAPFSEPETQNVRALLRERQVQTLITNHTYSNLVLRPPGIAAEGPTPDEPRYKALGDAMGKATGFVSKPSFGLYDTTGGLEDWGYYQAGALGFTYEIGPHEFHPPYEQVVAEYEGRAPTPVDGVAGTPKEGGVREGYLLALESALDEAGHSVLTGRGPAGGTVEISRSTSFLTSPVIGSEANEPLQLFDTMTSAMQVPASGRFAWHVNPSTRPYSKRDRSPRAETPVSSEPISGQPLPPSLVPVTVTEGDPRFLVASIAGAAASDDYDLYLYEGELPDPRRGVAQSATSSNAERIEVEGLAPGRYTLEVRNFSATGGWTGTVERFAPDTTKGQPAKQEAWTVTCKDASGTVVGTTQVVVDRGQRADVSAACPAPAPTPTEPTKPGKGGGNGNGVGNGNGPKPRQDAAAPATGRPAQGSTRTTSKQRPAKKARTRCTTRTTKASSGTRRTARSSKATAKRTCKAPAKKAKRRTTRR